MLTRRGIAASLAGLLTPSLAAAQESGGVAIRPRGWFGSSEGGFSMSSTRQVWLSMNPRPAPTAPRDEDSPDYRHLETSFSDSPFAFTARDAQRLFEHARLPLNRERNRLLIGIRGCELLDEESAFADGAMRPALLLREAQTDHLNLRCVIAIWDLSSGEFWASPASTIPDAASTFVSAHLNGGGTSQMTLGLYLYQVGTYRAATARPEPGILRQMRAGGVLRCTDLNAMSFDVRKWGWNGSQAFAHIHATVTPRQGYGLQYSSAGTQVIPGRYDRGDVITATGQFHTARRVLGIFAGPFAGENPDEGRQFDYLLTTARDCRLASRSAAPRPKLMLGSQGEEVARLQRAMGLEADGVFSWRTQQMLGAGQLNTWGGADCILTPAEAARLNLSGVFST